MIKKKHKKIPPKYGWLDDTMMYSRGKNVEVEKKMGKEGKKRESACDLVWVADPDEHCTGPNCMLIFSFFFLFSQSFIQPLKFASA